MDDHARQRARMIRGIHGRQPASLHAWWKWQLDQADHDLEDPPYCAVLRELNARQHEIDGVLRVVLKFMTARQAARFLESCIQCSIEYDPAQQERKRALLREVKGLKASLAETLRETAAALERLHYLQEEGIDAYDVEVFDPLKLLSVVPNTAFQLKTYMVLRSRTMAEHLESLCRENYFHRPHMPEFLQTLAARVEAGKPSFIEDDAQLAYKPTGKPGVAAIVRIITSHFRGEPPPDPETAMRACSNHDGMARMVQFRGISWRPLHLSDRDLATLLSVTLRRGSDNPVTEDQVKRARGRSLRKQEGTTAV